MADPSYPETGWGLFGGIAPFRVLGAVLLAAAPGVSRPDDKSMRKKCERYNRIALEAAKQCGRGRVPEVAPLVGFREAVAQMRADPLALFFYENADQPLREVLTGRLGDRVSILIGSEGGFEPSEAAFAAENGLVPLSLGSRILRCETAPLAAITAILYQAGDI